MKRQMATGGIIKGRVPAMLGRYTPLNDAERVIPLKDLKGYADPTPEERAAIANVFDSEPVELVIKCTDPFADLMGTALRNALEDTAAELPKCEHCDTTLKPERIGAGRYVCPCCSRITIVKE
jgi:hypothetical protein